MDPVDEFAKLRAEIKRLEDQAAALRATFLRPGTRLRSNQFEILVRRQTRRVFQKDLLPPEVLNNPRFWSESVSEIVTVKPLEWKSNLRKTNDDIVLIEAF